MQQHETIIIGGGLTGIYQLYRLLELGMDSVVLEAADDLGGTWYHNRYPGCRFDSESYTYGYSFSKELLDEWHWTEHFSPQPETLRYLNHVADKFDLRQHMRFGCRIKTAVYDEDTNGWTVSLESGENFRCRILITAIGVLSTPVMPKLDGIDQFRGPSFHTYHWPREPVELRGKRVAIIGTGATAVQPSLKWRRRPRNSTSCNAARTGARLCTTHRLTQPRWPISAHDTTRCSRSVSRRPAVSSMVMIAASSLRYRKQSGASFSRSSTRPPGSASG